MNNYYIAKTNDYKLLLCSLNALPRGSQLDENPVLLDTILSKGVDKLNSLSNASILVERQSEKHDSDD